MCAAPVALASIARGKVDLKGASEGATAKGARYIAELYEARCAGQWDTIGELARKLEKHAPKRRCMALAARAGSRMYSSPSPQNFKLAEDEFGEPLSQALANPETPPIDILDGTVTRAAMYLGVGKTQSALSLISESLHRIRPPSLGSGTEALISICVLQSTLIQGLCFELMENVSEAEKSYRQAIAYLAHVVKVPSQCSELRRWLEELLSRICLFFSQRPGHLGEAMASFHLLSQYLDGQAWRPLACKGTFTPQTPRQVWKAYFETLSKIVQDDLVYHPSPLYRDHESLEHRGLLDEDEFAATRMKQRADLRRVGSNYETLLLAETRFPKANEINDDIKSWVELVMGNFNILCGPTWTSQELGVGLGGKAVVARNVLEILYRAAEKTFQSTQILRHLFTVHSYLGEFDIAFKAFDTYVDIMARGKARVKISGNAGLDLDEDETAIRFAAEAIRVACRLGCEATAEKASSIGEILREWASLNSTKQDANNLAESKPMRTTDESQLSPDTVALAYHMVGISQALYARSTAQPASRAEMQKHAIENLRQALQQNIQSRSHVESYYALSLILAETRDIPGAIQNVKQALQYSPEKNSNLNHVDGVFSINDSKESVALDADEAAKHAKLLPVWHLLAQLLCAREEYELASACCDLSLERLGGVSRLLETEKEANMAPRTSVRDFHRSSKTISNPPNVVDSMDNLERQVILEIKMTRLTLLELLDGPEAAVNESNELLALFVRLFGPIDVDAQRKSKANTMISPPKSSSGTIRSIFGRPKSMRRAPPTGQTQSVVQSQATSVLPSNTASAITTRPTTSNANKPIIQVISPPEGPPTVPPVSDHERKPNVLRKKSSSIRRQDIPHRETNAAELDEKDGVNGAEPSKSSHARVSFHGTRVGDEKPKENGEPRALESTILPQGTIESHAPESTETAKHDGGPIPSTKQKRMSQTAPVFVEIQEQRFITTVVTKIWLFVARLYYKVSFFDDAKEAIQQARKHVSSLEEQVLQQNPSIRELQNQGWGRGKSVEQLWADIFCEEGKLQEAQTQPQEALDRYEIALSHEPDHPEATVALSNILLDIYCRDIRREKAGPLDVLTSQIGSSPTEVPLPISETSPVPPNKRRTPAHKIPEPEELSRLASRDRAYGLLSSLTRLGSSWDDAEAWFVLARAYEESGQVEKAKEALWWTVHLEDTKPIRHWRNVHPAAYVL